MEKEAILSIPIPVIDFAKQSEKELHTHITNLVNNLLQLNEQLQSTQLETGRQQIRRSIAHAEKKIDELVYQLYGLTEDEIKIIEGD